MIAFWKEAMLSEVVTNERRRDYLEHPIRWYEAAHILEIIMN
jgi:hypothetical protein